MDIALQTYMCTQTINVIKIRPKSAYYNDHQAILELLIERFPSTQNMRVLLSAIAISMQKCIGYGCLKSFQQPLSDI